MKAIVATEKVFNDHGDLICLIYHYEDGSQSERKMFVPASMVNDPERSPKVSEDDILEE